MAKGQEAGFGKFDQFTFFKTPLLDQPTQPPKCQLTFMTSTVCRAGKSYHVLRLVLFVLFVFVVLFRLF